jgi:geranyl-CoA carboxylase beta subunit
VTGLGEYLAENDAHAIAMARDLMDHLPWDEQAGPPTGARAPLYDAAGTAGHRAGRRARALRRARDHRPHRRWLALPGIQGRASTSDTMCGHARIDGHRVGIIANNGPIQPTGSVKAAQFIQLCDQSGTPLVFLQNTTGYMVGTAAERAAPSSTAAR